MKRDNLVVVRAGANSLHHRWLEMPYADRAFDLLVSYYSKSAFEAHIEATGVKAVLHEGGKWDGLFKTLSPMDLDAYRYYWLPDDDIDLPPAKVNEIFACNAQFKLAISQPALTRDSYYSHFFFNACGSFLLRYTNYIEIMAPCLDQATLKRALPLFEKSMSGFGLDYVWCRWAETGPFRVAIIDTVRMHHTRPVGSALKASIASQGKTPVDEEAVLKSSLGLSGRTVPLAFAGLSLDHEPVVGRAKMAFRMIGDWLSDFSGFSDRRGAVSGILKVFRRQLTKPLNFSRLEDPHEQ